MVTGLSFRDFIGLYFCVSVRKARPRFCIDRRNICIINTLALPSGQAAFMQLRVLQVSFWEQILRPNLHFLGSRAGLNIALTWATLLHFGRNTYRDRALKILEAKQYLVEQLKRIAGIRLVGSPDVTVVAFRSNDFNIYAVGDLLNKRGWNLNSLQSPDA
jgi:glutamate/tyrosine decarboxylase-like PLP-dependent enzyme